MTNQSTSVPHLPVGPAPGVGAFSHPIWLAGFRPFFTLAFVAGALLPLVWAAAFSGALPWRSTGPSSIAWHAHEMFFGFGWAVLGGFLLTASKNWVKIRGIHGGALAVAVLLWLLERGAIFIESPLFSRALLNVFPVYVVGYLVWTLVRYRRQDAFADNWFFVVALPLFLVAKNLLVTPSMWLYGTTMTLGLFRVAFAVMFERTMPQFMKNAMGTPLPKRRWLDMPIKLLVMAAVFEALLPVNAAVVVLGLAALLLFARLLTWKPWVGMKRFEIAVMYVGYLGLVAHFALSSLRYAGLYAGLGSLSTHVFTFLCMGMVIPPMLIRISQGHNGRKLRFTRADRIAMAAMGVAAFFRLVATQLWPALLMEWIYLAAIGWSLCFVLIGLRVVPFLWQPRIDGKVH